MRGPTGSFALHDGGRGTGSGGQSGELWLVVGFTAKDRETLLTVYLWVLFGSAFSLWLLHLKV